jgi:hypothetical protein
MTINYQLGDVDAHGAEPAAWRQFVTESGRN